MFCNKCGQELPDFSVACFRCGQRLVSQVQPIQAPEQKTVVIKEKSNNTFGIIITIILIGILGVGAIISLGLFQIRSVPSSFVNTSKPQIQTQNQQATMQNDGNTTYCYLISKANVKINCDSKDCDNDPSTVWGYGIEGDEVYLTGNFVSSTNGYDWREVTGYKRKVFIASSKLDCKF